MIQATVFSRVSRVTPVARVRTTVMRLSIRNRGLWGRAVMAIMTQLVPRGPSYQGHNAAGADHFLLRFPVFILLGWYFSTALVCSHHYFTWKIILSAPPVWSLCAICLGWLHRHILTWFSYLLGPPNLVSCDWMDQTIRMCWVFALVYYRHGDNGLHLYFVLFVIVSI